MVEWIKMKLGMEVGLGQGDIVLDWDPAPLPNWQSPQFSANVCYGQTAKWIKMKLGMDVLAQATLCVRWRSSSPERAQHPPNFRPMYFSGYVYSGQTAGWIEMPVATEYGGRARPRPHCVR